MKRPKLYPQNLDFLFVMRELTGLGKCSILKKHSKN